MSQEESRVPIVVDSDSDSSVEEVPLPRRRDPVRTVRSSRSLADIIQNVNSRTPYGAYNFILCLFSSLGAYSCCFWESYPLVAFSFPFIFFL